MFQKRMSVCLVAAACGLACSTASAQRMYGVTWSGGSLYSIDLGTGAATFVGSPGVGPLNSAAAVPGRDLIYAQTVATALYEIDVNTGAVANSYALDDSAISGYTIRGLAVDGNGTIYAVADTAPFGSIDVLVTIDLNTLSYNVVGPMNEPGVQGLAFHQGRLYAVVLDNTGGPAQLFSVDPTTGATNAIGGDFGSNQQTLESCDGRLYASRVELVSVDPATGATTLIGSHGATDDIRGLACVGESMGCYPDCTGEGTLDIFDFLCFQDDFVAGGSYACECNGDPVCDIFDFLCFQDAFVQGCP